METVKTGQKVVMKSFDKIIHSKFGASPIIGGPFFGIPIDDVKKCAGKEFVIRSFTKSHAIPHVSITAAKDMKDWRWSWPIDWFEEPSKQYELEF